MSYDRLVLGADIREDSLILSCALENQKELIHESFSLLKERDAD